MRLGRFKFMKTKINVTHEDILKGKPGNACFCPLALACFRGFGANVTIAVNKVWDASGDFVADLPAEAIQFYADFDLGKPVRAFEFELEVEEDSAHPSAFGMVAGKA